MVKRGGGGGRGGKGGLWTGKGKEGGPDSCEEEGPQTRSAWASEPGRLREEDVDVAAVTQSHYRMGRRITATESSRSSSGGGYLKN